MIDSVQDTTTTEGMRKRLSEMRKTGDTTTTEGMRRRLSEMRRNRAEKRGSDKLENSKNKKSKTPENQSSAIPPLVPSSFSPDSSLLPKSPGQSPTSGSLVQQESLVQQPGNSSVQQVGNSSAQQLGNSSISLVEPRDISVLVPAELSYFVRCSRHILLREVINDLESIPPDGQSATLGFRVRIGYL